LGRKTALVTGSTDGVGRYVALRLAGQSFKVLLHGRNRQRAEEVLGEIRRGGGEATFYQVDFASLGAVRDLAAAVRRDHARLDLVINNAGIFTGSDGNQWCASADGLELRFAVNYLSGFLLTHLLLPLLRTSAPARIVNVASAGQQPIDFDDVMLTKGYDAARAYRQSKLAQVMFTFDLAAELAGSGITVNCLHPATFMATTMVRQAGIAPASTVEEGGEAILRLAISPQLDGRTGLYFNGVQEAHANPQAYDTAAREKLRTLSLALTGLWRA
jgi:NAD(P)-dependent dehydrogenase (short-subunit alcohol dehydrogenase family)